jgi:hypothetical protein
MLEKEQQKLARMEEKNKELEVENFLLKDKIEMIREKLMQVEHDEQVLSQLIDKLEAENEQGRLRQLVHDIKEVREEQKKVTIHIETIDKATNYSPPLLTRPEDAQPPDASFDFLHEASQIVKEKPKEVEVCPADAVDRSHFRRAEEGRGKRKVVPKVENQIVRQLIQRALNLRGTVMAMPKKLLLRVISTTYKELLQRQEEERDVASHLFATLMKDFGLRSVAERRFLQVHPEKSNGVDRSRVHEAQKKRASPAIWPFRWHL